MASLLFAESSRRRSQSASPSGHHASDKAVESRPQPFGRVRLSDRGSLVSDKWDADLRRKGTKRKQGLSSPTPEPGTLPASIFSIGQRRRPALATSPAEFQLGTARNNLSAPSRCRGRASEPESLASDYEMLSEPDMSRLRSEADSELHRSVAETSERFVRRMRELEQARTGSRPDIKTGVAETRRRGHKRAPAARCAAFTCTQDASDDDDEVVIYTGEHADPFGGNPRRKRMRAAPGDGDPEASPERSSGYSSPSAPFDSASSASPSDDDDDVEIDVGMSCSDAFRPLPELSSAETNSTASSCASLHSSPPSDSLPLPSSRSEKALAALTLAMEHGVGVVDYAALRVAPEGALDGPYDDSYWG